MRTSGRHLVWMLGALIGCASATAARPATTLDPPEPSLPPELVSALAGEPTPKRCSRLAAALDARPRATHARLDMYRAADLLRRCGDFVRAERALRTLGTVRNADVPAAWVFNGLGLVAADRGDLQAAVEAFDQAIRADPDLVQAQWNALVVEVRRYERSLAPGSFDAARVRAEALLAKKTRVAATFLQLARLEMARTRTGQANGDSMAELYILEAQRRVPSSMDRADAFNLLGILSRRRGDPLRALRAWQAAVREDPSSASAHANLAIHGVEARDFALAEREARAALQLGSPQVRTDMLLVEAVAARGLGRLEEAHRALRTLGTEVRADPRWLFNLGVLEQDHLAPRGEPHVHLPRAYEFFSRFLERAATDPAYAEAVDIARRRMSWILDQVRPAHAQPGLAESNAAARAAQEREAAERARLLELERRALDAASRRDPEPGSKNGQFLRTRPRPGWPDLFRLFISTT